MDDVKQRMQALADAVISRSADIRFSRKNAQQLYCVALLETIVEAYSAIVTLVQVGNCSPIPAIGRTVLEAYIDLINLSENHNYTKHLEAAYLKEQIRVLDAAVKSEGKNPWLVGLAKSPGIAAKLSQIRNELEFLNKSGFAKLNVDERFKRAGFLDMYRSVYAELCIHSHNNIRALDDRHIEQSGEDCRMVFFRGTQLSGIEHFLENVSGCTVDALRRVGKIANFKGRHQL